MFCCAMCYKLIFLFMLPLHSSFPHSQDLSIILFTSFVAQGQLFIDRAIDITITWNTHEGRKP